MIAQWAQSAGSYAGDIDGLIWLVTIIVGFWFFAAQGMFFWLIFRFRKQEGVPAQYVTGKEPHLKRWINIPHFLVLVCDVLIIAAAIKVWVAVKQTMPPVDEQIRVVGQQWAWTFVQPGLDGKLDTPDDIVTTDDLHVQVGKTYQFLLESKDVLHSFSVPVFRLKQDVVPGRTITGWFKAIKTGTFDIQCAEICGIGHGVMSGRIHIEDAAEHTAWVTGHTPVTATAATAAEGAH
jgi:cytochrome c oxidase subunit II